MKVRKTQEGGVERDYVKIVQIPEQCSESTAADSVKIEREREREREREERYKQLYRFLPQSGSSPVPVALLRRVH